jgi:hypothetical protein
MMTMASKVPVVISEIVMIILVALGSSCIHFLFSSFLRLSIKLNQIQGREYPFYSH